MLVDGLGSIPMETARHFAAVIARDAGRLGELLCAGGRSLEPDGVAGEEHGQTAGPWPVMSAHGRPSILVADDDPDVRNLVRIHFEARGWVVRQAVDGAEAVASCYRRAPDLVVLDVHMPRLDGWEVMARLQADPGLRHVAVIMLTSRHGTPDLVQGLREGAHDYLGKPFAPAELCARADAALRVKRLADELRRDNTVLSHSSRTDWLTGLPNRRHVEERLAELASASRRHHQDLAVVMIDIDSFKKVNDELGHPAGDAVLREVANRLRSVLRAEDLVGRWGGDEFCVVLPGTDVRRAQAVAARLRAAVARSPIDVGERGRLSRVLASAGSAAGSDPDVLVEAADHALYVAKRAGRRAGSDPRHRGLDGGPSCAGLAPVPGR